MTEAAKQSSEYQIYGWIQAPNGIEQVLLAVQHLVGDEGAYIYKSAYDGAKSLKVRTEECDMESVPTGTDDIHLLNGMAFGKQSIGAELVNGMSSLLSSQKISHRFELYDQAGKLLLALPHSDL